MSEQLSEYPTDRIVGIAEEPSTVDAIRSAVAASGVPGTDVEVIRPHEREQVTTDDDASDGILATVRTLFGDETPHLRRLAVALEQGASVVLVTVPDLDGMSDAEVDEAKQTIGDAMVDAGAADVTYFGRWAIEQLGLATD